MKIHETKIDKVQRLERSIKGIKIAIEDFEDDPAPDDLIVIAGNSKRVLGFKNPSISEIEIDDCYHFLYLMIQCSCNLFTLSLSNQEEETITVDTVQRPARTVGAKKKAGATEWSDGFFAALIGREKNATELLRKVPTDDIKAAHFQIEKFLLSYMDFLKSLGTPEALTNLARVKDDLKAHSIVTDEEVKCLYQPKMDLWTAIFNADHGNFNALLEAAVIGHNAYWKIEKDDDGNYRTNDPNGYFALELTAIAAYAHDRGMKVTYQSDYLPKFFMEGYMTIAAKVTMP